MNKEKIFVQFIGFFCFACCGAWGFLKKNPYFGILFSLLIWNVILGRDYQWMNCVGKIRTK